MVDYIGHDELARSLADSLRTVPRPVAWTLPLHPVDETLTGVLHRALEMHGHKEAATEEDAG